MVKNLSAVQICVCSLGQKDPVEKGMDSHSSILQSLENSMDKGAWQAIVHGVATSDTTEQLKLALSVLSHFQMKVI